jgi:hypothetical protein
MPFAKKFRAMMDFPFPGDAIGNFIVESIDVRDEPSSSVGYSYKTRMVLRGPGGKQGVRRALRPLFSKRLMTFSGFGNPYHIWFKKPTIESLGDKRYAVSVKGAGVHVKIQPELDRFLRYLQDEGLLTVQTDSAVRHAWVEDYLERYRGEIKRKVDRYRGLLRKK